MSSLSNKLIFNKFQAKKLLFNSSSSKVYEGLNKLTKEPVAIKFEKIGGKYALLQSEAYFLLLLKGFGIPRFISFGKYSNYKILVEELLGPSIFLIWNNKNTKTRLSDICLIALQCLDRLEYIHSKGIIHKDIKPYNFLFGRNDPNVIYVIDFGISKKYKSSRTGKHIKYNNLKTINGSFRYMSINCNKGYEQSRKDDLESLGYMLVYLTKEDLPWSDLENNNKMSKFLQSKKICEKKIKTTPEELCLGLPSEFSEFIKYTRQLEFEEEPNYNYIKNLFVAILKRNEQLIDERFIGFIRFSWLKKNMQKKTNNHKSAISYSKYNDSKKRKGSAHRRLYKNIKDSIDKAKSQELPQIRNSNLFKFKVKDINKFLNDIKTNEKKKTENNNTNNLRAMKTKSKINENTNNKIDKNIINKIDEIKKSLTELEKIKHSTYVKKMNIYNTKITTNQSVKSHKNFFKSYLENNKTSNNIINYKSIINLNKTENSLDTDNDEKLSLRYYKTIKEREKIKEYKKKYIFQYLIIHLYYLIMEVKNIIHFVIINIFSTSKQ